MSSPSWPLLEFVHPNKPLQWARNGLRLYLWSCRACWAFGTGSNGAYITKGHMVPPTCRHGRSIRYSVPFCVLAKRTTLLLVGIKPCLFRECQTFQKIYKSSRKVRTNGGKSQLAKSESQVSGLYLNWFSSLVLPRNAA